MPLLAVDVADPAIRVILTDLPPRRIALIWHRDRYRSPASLAFVQIACEVAATLRLELDTMTFASAPTPR